MNSNLEKAIKADIGYSEKANKICKYCDTSYCSKTRNEQTYSTFPVDAQVDRCGLYHEGFSIKPEGTCKHWKEKQLKNM